MLPSVIKGARIWAFDYNSNYSHNAQTVWINGLATTLLNCIKDRHDDFKSRNIVFVGSCFGGIVVAEVIISKRLAVLTFATL
jgi:poly(3-hydroxyalkanoate) synthetase